MHVNDIQQRISAYVAFSETNSGFTDGVHKKIIMKKHFYSIILFIFITLTGCIQQVDNAASDQRKSDEYVYSVSELSICNEEEINEDNIFYDSSFNTMNVSEIYSSYFNKNSKNEDYILLSPIKLMPYAKVNETPVFFVDAENTILVKDNYQKLEINPHYSNMNVNSLTECTITVYFYPVVSQNERSDFLLKKVQHNHQTYCDGIYEIRINEIPVSSG